MSGIMGFPCHINNCDDFLLDIFCISVGFLSETNIISNLYYQNDVSHAYIYQTH